MSLLQYTSNEMFSSTELIRKSKMVFDKVQNKTIEKAIILRDGKPSFIMMDFVMYEKLISEYLELKENNKNEKAKSKNIPVHNEIKNIKNEINTNSIDEINNDDLEKALNQIEKLSIKEEGSQIIPQSKELKEQPLKDFWE